MFISTDLNNLSDITVHFKEAQYCKIYLNIRYMHIPTVQMSNLPTVLQFSTCIQGKYQAGKYLFSS